MCTASGKKREPAALPPRWSCYPEDGARTGVASGSVCHQVPSNSLQLSSSDCIAHFVPLFLVSLGDHEGVKPDAPSTVQADRVEMARLGLGDGPPVVRSVDARGRGCPRSAPDHLYSALHEQVIELIPQPAMFGSRCHRICAITVDDNHPPDCPRRGAAGRRERHLPVRRTSHTVPS